MFSVTSSSDSCGVITEKKYEFEATENPEFVEHCKKFLLCSISLPDLPSFGFFQELQNKVACTGCQKPYFYLKKIEKKKEKGSGSGVIAASDEVFSIGSDGDGDGDGDGDHCEHERISSQNEYFCAICYVRRFCNVHTFQNHDGSETYYIFKAKSGSGSGSGILYQSSPIIERPSDSDF